MRSSFYLVATNLGLEQGFTSRRHSPTRIRDDRAKHGPAIDWLTGVGQHCWLTNRVLRGIFTVPVFRGVRLRSITDSVGLVICGTAFFRVR